MPDTGFHFKCLDYDTTAGAIRTVTIREGQPTLRAICESDETYTVETYANPSRGGTVTGAATGLHYGDVVTVEAISAPGYRFVEWADDDEDLVIRTFAITEDLALEAYFEEIPSEEYALSKTADKQHHPVQVYRRLVFTYCWPSYERPIFIKCRLQT